MPLTVSFSQLDTVAGPPACPTTEYESSNASEHRHGPWSAQTQIPVPRTVPCWYIHAYEARSIAASFLLLPWRVHHGSLLQPRCSSMGSLLNRPLSFHMFPQTISGVKKKRIALSANFFHGHFVSADFDSCTHTSLRTRGFFCSSWQTTYSCEVRFIPSRREVMRQRSAAVNSPRYWLKVISWRKNTIGWYDRSLNLELMRVTTSATWLWTSFCSEVDNATWINTI